MNMKAIKNGRLLLNETIYEGKVIIFDQKIVDITTEDQLDLYEITDIYDADGHYILPGFIDAHIHGYKGMDVMDSKVESLEGISQAITQNGVTSYLATTMTMSKEKIRKTLQTISNYMKNEYKGAEVLGVHLEGPFIHESYKGAQKSEYIIPPDDSIIEGFEPIIKVITIAPEVKGALAFIEKYANTINFSLGHTSANYQIAIKAFEKGAMGTTHTFNAMTGLHHREPGVVGAALNSNCYSELIADKIHVNENLFQLLVKVKGIDRLMLITDCIEGGGLGDGEYTLGGQKVIIKDGKSVLEDGTIAGSVLKLNIGLKNVKDSTDLKFEELIKLVTTTPAKYLGVYDKKGSLDIGKDADIVIVDEDINIKKTFTKGHIVYEI